MFAVVGGRWGRAVFAVAAALVAVGYLFASCDRGTPPSTGEDAPAGEGDGSGTAASATALFEALPASESGVAFENRLRPDDDLNIVTYLYYYNGGGVAIGDATGDGLPDLYLTSNQGLDRYYVNEGDLRFREATAEAGLDGAPGWSSGASFADVDDDGDLDLYVAQVSGVVGLRGVNRTYLNDGTGGFSVAPPGRGLDFAGLGTQAAFFDADGDGDTDAYLLNHSVHGTSRLEDTSQRSKVDLVSGDRLLIQGADGVFADQSATRGIRSSRLGYGLGVAVGDLTGDGALDVYVANDFGENDYLYVNAGDGNFRERSDRYLQHTSRFSMGTALADLNADGLPDVVTLDMRPSRDSVRKSSAGAEDLSNFQLKTRFGFGPQYARNHLQLAGPDGTFTDVGAQYGVHSSDWSWSPVAFDADLDGYTDLFVGNGIVQRPNDLDYLKYSSGAAVQRSASNLEVASLMPPGLERDVVYRGGARPPLRDVAVEWGLAHYGSSTGSAAADLDGDGDEDLVVNRLNGPAVVYRNRAAQRGARGVTVDPFVHQAYAKTVGATVVLVHPNGTWATAQVVQPVSGFQSSSVRSLVFGVPDTSTNYVLTVRWPYGGCSRDTVRVGELATPRRVEEGEGSPCEPAASGLASAARTRAEIDWALPEFDREPLLPFTWRSRLAEKRAEFDVDGDGRAEALRVQLDANLPFGRSSRWFADGVPLDPSEAFGYRPGMVSDVQLLRSGSLLVASLFGPVVRLTRGSGGVRVDTVAPAGLWTTIDRVDGYRGGGEAFLFGNLGHNTLLTASDSTPLQLVVGDFDENGRADPILVCGQGPEATTFFGLDEIAGQMPVMRRFFTRYLPFSSSSYESMFPRPVRERAATYEARELRSAVYVTDGEAEGADDSPLRYLPPVGQRGAARSALLTGAGLELNFLEVVAHPEVGTPAWGAARVAWPPR